MKKGKVLGLALVLAAGIGCGSYFIHEASGKEQLNEGETAVFMESVRSICDLGYTGLQRYTGVIDTQETKDLQLDTRMTLKDVFVSVGDEVKKGDPLFSYDTEEIDQKIRALELELEEGKYMLENMENRLSTLQKKAAAAKPEEVQTIQLEILTTENQKKRQEYDNALMELEKSRLEKDMSNAVVFSDMQGIVQSISNGGNSNTISGTSDSSFLSILATGDYRIKGSCNELDIWSLSIGDAMLIYPRNGSNKVYTGVVTKIDTEPLKENSSGYSVQSGESSSKYTFYVTLNENMDLLLASGNCKC